MPAFAAPRVASFLGVKFPVTEVNVSGGARLAEHTYAYTPGAYQEPLGRDPVTVTMSAIFANNFPSYGPTLYPQALNQLERRLEAEERGVLVIPGKGTLTRVQCKSWNRRTDSKLANGERVDFTFVECLEEDFSTENLATEGSGGFRDNVLKFKEAQTKLSFKPNIFSQIEDVANQLQAYIDTPKLIASLAVAKVASLVGLIQRAENSVLELADPLNTDIAESLRDLWFSAQSLVQVEGNSLTIETYEVPKTTTIDLLAYTLYGDSGLTQEIIALNTLEDLQRIPAGTKIRYIEGITALPYPPTRRESQVG